MLLQNASPFAKKTFSFFAVCAGRGLQHSGLQLRGTARKRLGGQGGRGLGGLVQLFAGNGQHQLDAVLLIDAGGAGVVVHGGDVRVRVQGADLIDHALAHDVVGQTAEGLGADDVRDPE